MRRVALITAGLVTLAGATLLGLRYLARRQGLPCPSWLAGILENPYTDAVAGGRVILDRADIRPGMRVLDAGSGPGRLTIPAAERVGPGGEVVALDIQPGMLARLEARVREHGVGNVRMVQGALGQGVLDHDHFDRALLVTVLGEVPDREAALRELYGALKPGGVLSATEVLPDPHYQPLRTVRRLAERCGFQLESTHGNVFAFTANFRRPGP